MIYIAHRGLINGPDKELENKPEHIIEVLNMGFQVELDLRVIESKLYLGHDGPQYPIEPEFLQKPGLWIHAKNSEALFWLTHTYYNYFWHQEDDFTITSRGHIWTYPGKPLSEFSICVMPEWNYNISEFNFNCYGVCSDYVGLMK
jgi:hypothetical protein